MYYLLEVQDLIIMTLLAIFDGRVSYLTHSFIIWIRTRDLPSPYISGLVTGATMAKYMDKKILTSIAT